MTRRNNARLAGFSYLLYIAAPSRSPHRSALSCSRTVRSSPRASSALGSTFFSWLLLRGRMIPTALAWLGVVASVLLVVALPLQLGGVLRGAVTQFMWLPMAAFEIPLGFWLIIKGVREDTLVA